MNAADEGAAVAADRELWLQWRSERREGARAALLDAHLPYARVVAASYFAKRFHNEIEFDDYLQFARVGLLEAMERFDPDAGVQFQTFAARRMHGAILDGLERLSEKQQQIAARRRLEAQRLELMKAAAFEAPVAQGPTRSQDQVLQFVAEAGLAFALEWILDGTGMIASQERSKTSHFYEAVELRELRERVLELVQQLPHQERKVIHGHYLQQQPLESIATELGVSRSRVSQLHAAALRRLRDSLRSPPACNISV